MQMYIFDRNLPVHEIYAKQTSDTAASTIPDIVYSVNVMKCSAQHRTETTK